MTRGGTREYHVEAGERHVEAQISDTWRQKIVTRGDMRDGHMEPRESDTWNERGPHGGTRECHMEACESDTWRHEIVLRGGKSGGCGRAASSGSMPALANISGAYESTFD